MQGWLLETHPREGLQKTKILGRTVGTHPTIHD
jgi:hypothetical protein